MSKGCIIVTGASKGIGAAISSRLAASGYQVGCLSRSGSMPAAETASANIQANCFAISCDVSDENQLQTAFAATAEHFKQPLIGLVNNAGVHSQGKTETLRADEFRRVMDINAVAVLAASQTIYPYFMRQAGGLIVNIGSFFDKLGIKQHVAYCAAKAAVGAMTRCMAVEWANRGIRVLNVAPGYIMTDMNREAMQTGPLADYLAKRIPGGKPGQADDVAKLVESLFLMDNAFMTGETIYIDGAHGMLG